MTDLIVHGYDLSLSATGVASTTGWTRQIKTRPVPTKAPSDVKARLTVERLQLIAADLHDIIVGERPNLVCIEGPSFGSKHGQAHERGGLWWRVAEDLYTRGIPFAVVPPSVLKMYATGVGNADKTAMATSAARRLPFDDLPDDNTVDAAWLAALGADAHGQPMVTMPAKNRAAVERVEWPGVGA